MSRKKLPEGKNVPKAPTLNKLLDQLEDPRSMFSFLTPDFQKCLLNIPHVFRDLDECTLLNKLSDQYAWRPTPSQEVLRENFWVEYDRVQLSRVENMMVLDNVFQGVMTRSGFHTCMKDWKVACYITTRSMTYEMTMQALQKAANRRLADFLNIPLKKTNGEYQDTKLLELVLKTAVVVDLRNKGAYLQRSETKNLTLINQKTSHTSYSNVFQAASGIDSERSALEIEEDITKKIRELELEAQNQLPPPMPKVQVKEKKNSFPKGEVSEAEFKEVVLDKEGDE